MGLDSQTLSLGIAVKEISNVCPNELLSNYWGLGQGPGNTPAAGRG